MLRSLRDLNQQGASLKFLILTLIILNSGFAFAKDQLTGRDVMKSLAYMCSNENYSKLLTWADKNQYLNEEVRTEEFKISSNKVESKDHKISVQFLNKQLVATIGTTIVKGSDPCELALNIYSYGDEKVTSSWNSWFISEAHAKVDIERSDFGFAAKTVLSIIGTGAVCTIAGLATAAFMAPAAIGMGFLCIGGAGGTYGRIQDRIEAEKLYKAFKSDVTIHCDQNSATIQADGFKFVSNKYRNKPQHLTYILGQGGLYLPYEKIPTYQKTLYAALDEIASVCRNENDAKKWTTIINTESLERTQRIAQLDDIAIKKSSSPSPKGATKQ